MEAAKKNAEKKIISDVRIQLFLKIEFLYVQKKNMNC